MKTIDLHVARIAAWQLGLITRQQLRALGMSVRQVEMRLSSGALVVVHRGVYRLAGFPDTPDQRLIVACLAGGPGTVASHRAAGQLWGLRGVSGAPLEITVPGRRVTVPGVVAHTTKVLPRLDVTKRSLVPVTTPARTLFDLGAVLPVELLERALDDAGVRGLVSFSLVKRTYHRLAHGRRTLLGELLAERDPDTAPTESDLESAILDVMRAGGLPEPVRQHPVGRWRIDLAYPDRKLGIEGDSTRWHTARQDLDRNARKRNALLHAGYRLLYFTWGDTRRRPGYIVASVGRELVREAVAPAIA